MKSKIARLPKSLRHQLGLRIEDNHPGVDLVQWLNSLPEVQKIVADQFNGSPISEQNICDWKSSGHLDWLRHEQAREAAVHLLETGDDLHQAAAERSFSDCFAAILTVHLSQVALALMDKETDLQKKWQLVCQMNRELSRLRRDDDRAKRTALDQARGTQADRRQMELAVSLAKAANGSHLVTQALDNLNENDDRTRVKLQLPDRLSGFETAVHLHPTKSATVPINGTPKPQQIQENPI